MGGGNTDWVDDQRDLALRNSYIHWIIKKFIDLKSDIYLCSLPHGHLWMMLWYDDDELSKGGTRQCLICTCQTVWARADVITKCTDDLTIITKHGSLLKESITTNLNAHCAKLHLTDYSLLWKIMILCMENVIIWI